MSSVLDAVLFLFLGSPVVALVLCGWVLTTVHLRPVAGAAILLVVVDGVALCSYWFLWGRAFDIVDAGGSVAVASRLGMDAAMGTGVVAVLGLVGLVCVRSLRAARQNHAPRLPRGCGRFWGGRRLVERP